jgi:hypothetical protein
VVFNNAWIPVRYWAEPITPEDKAKFRIREGESEFMPILEALVVVISLRLWSHEAEGATIAIRSDNLGVCSVLEKLRSSNPSLNLLAAEVALDLAFLSYSPLVIHHIPGRSNLLPDALSRLHQPGAATVIPLALKAAVRVHPPKRDGLFWRVKRL